MTLHKGDTVYMVGIGGVGMSALAQLYLHKGVKVFGSDREPSVTTKMLCDKGIDVYIGHRALNIPESYSALIYSDAVPFENTERARARLEGVPEYSYFQALGFLSKEMFTIAVSGSHGKTTTTALLGKILIDAEVPATVIVGSIIKDFGSNFIAGSEGGPLVVEACEYRNHILELSPTLLVVTNLEWDHTDFFLSLDELKNTFKTAIEHLPKHGALIIDTTTAIGKELSGYAPCRVVNYADCSVPPLGLLGEFNARNAQAAKTTAIAYDETIPEETSNHSLQSFQGSWRRFDFHGQTKEGALVYDDYAHHPTEIRATITAVREKFPEKKVVVAFHPHLYSRTRDLFNEFVESLCLSDVVVVAPIYAAREEPIEGISSALLVAHIVERGGKARVAASLGDVASLLLEYDSANTIFITMGAGDIYKIIDDIVE